MRALRDMETIQVEITNACHNTCSNCTRLCGHHPSPYFMPLEEVKAALDTLINFPKIVGIMGGEPLLHPQFKEICEYMCTILPKEHCGLWTCLPKGKEHYREVIADTFGHIFINDHTREDILHAPILVAAEEVPLPPSKKDYLISKCWVQESWSASINPKGAWFCEVAAALAMTLDIEGLGWKVENHWWARSPQHFIEQMKMCHYCGCAMPLKRRASIDRVDDISPKMFERLKEISPKIIKGNYVISDMKIEEEDRQLATYKDSSYRDAIAKRYGMFLMLNDQGYQEPYLLRNWSSE